LNRFAHLVGGAVSPWVLIAVYSYSSSIWPNLLTGSDFLATGVFLTGLGAVGGVLPDSFEPPKRPRHRGFFHYVFGSLSAIFYFLVLLGSLKIISFEVTVYFADLIKFLILAVASGYASHFLLDIFFST